MIASMDNKFLRWVMKVYPCAVPGCGRRDLRPYKILPMGQEMGNTVMVCGVHQDRLLELGLIGFQREHRTDMLQFAEAMLERFYNTFPEERVHG